MKTMKKAIVDLYHERAGLLDDELDNDVDLASYAYQIWKNAITQDPRLEQDHFSTAVCRLFDTTAPPDG